MIDMNGKVSLVTGGSRGIGAAIVRTLVGLGGDVVLHYGHSAERAARIAGELGHRRCLPLRADLAEPGAARGLWRDALAWKGRIDVVVNNAGIYEAAGIDHDAARWDEVWDRTLRIDLIAAADLCREALRHFRANAGGTIINVASRAAFRGDAPDYMAYAASKAGLVALTRTIARGFGGDGVVAFAVAPGFVRTEMAETFFATHGEEPVVSEIPLGEIAAPQDVANVVAFLASGLARHATGTTIDVNGASYVR